MRNQSLGTSLVQYIIITCILALFIIPIYFIYGQTIYLHLNNFYKALVQNNSDNIATEELAQNVAVEKVLVKGPLGGTIEKPVSQCDNGNCTIDFGEYVLQGIPENFNEFVQVAGTPGTTDVIANLFMQMAEQLEKEDKIDQAVYFKHLANMEHQTANVQREIENFIKAHPEKVSDTCKKDCFGNIYYSLDKPWVMPDVPDNIVGLMRETYSQAPVKFLVNEQTAFNSYLLDASPKVFDKYCSNSDSATRSAICYYNQIQRDESISDAMKAVSKELIMITARMATNFATITEEIAVRTNVDPPPPAPVILYDPITGEPLEAQEVEGENIITPQTSTQTNINGVLTCATGNYTDTGEDCE